MNIIGSEINLAATIYTQPIAFEQKLSVLEDKSRLLRIALTRLQHHQHGVYIDWLVCLSASHPHTDGQVTSRYGR